MIGKCMICENIKKLAQPDICCDCRDWYFEHYDL